jgi:hypothetical protein
MKDHLTDFQLNEFVHTKESTSPQKHILEHLESCPRCRERVDRLWSLDHALRTQHLPASDERQVSIIMQRIRSSEGQSLSWIIGIRFAYIIAMMLVLGAVGWVFTSFDVITVPDIASGISTGEGTLQEIFTTVQNEFSRSMQIVSRFFSVYISEILGNAGVILFILLVAIALLDRLIFEPLLKRSN